MIGGGRLASESGIEQALKALRANRGTDEAMAILVEHYSPRVSHAFPSWAPKDEREDLTQTVWTRVYEKRALLPVESKDFQKYLTRMAMTECVNWLRREKRTVQPTGLAAGQDFEDLRQVSPELKAAHAEAIDRLEESLIALPARQRQVMALLIQGNTYRQIATILQIPLGTVKSNMVPARKRLLEKLSKVLIDLSIIDDDDER